MPPTITRHPVVPVFTLALLALLLLPSAVGGAVTAVALIRTTVDDIWSTLLGLVS